MWMKLVVGFCMHSWPRGAFGVAMCGGTGSCVVFSLVLKGSLMRSETLDICFEVEVRSCGRGERGQGLGGWLIALLIHELGLGFKEWNSAISS